MKLTEFYSLNEGHDKFYTIEPDGRLLEWDQAQYNDVGEIMYEELSFEEVARGSMDKLIGELMERMPLTSEDMDKIEYAMQMENTVAILKEGDEVVVRV